MRTFISIAIISILYLFVSSCFGLNITLFIFSAMFLIAASLFTYDKRFYDYYFSFVNPKYKKIMKEKDEDFAKHNRKVNIISYYILSILMFINGLLTSKSKIYIKLSLSLKDYMFFAGVMMSVGILLYFTNNYLLKKSKENGDYIGGSIILGIIIVVLVFIALRIFG